MENQLISLKNIDVLVFDFDGVLKNNIVHLDQDGKEWVSCSRADGLGFDVLRKLKIPVYILSTEKNLVVTARANKLNIPVLQGVNNKVDAIKSLADSQGFDLQRILYVGNDLNDYHVMQLCGYTACPADSHIKIKELSRIVLNASGGHGVVRELLEEVFQVDMLDNLYL